MKVSDELIRPIPDGADYRQAIAEYPVMDRETYIEPAQRLWNFRVNTHRLLMGYPGILRFALEGRYIRHPHSHEKYPSKQELQSLYAKHKKAFNKESPKSESQREKLRAQLLDEEKGVSCSGILGDRILEDYMKTLLKDYQRLKKSKDADELSEWGKYHLVPVQIFLTEFEKVSKDYEAIQSDRELMILSNLRLPYSRLRRYRGSSVDESDILQDGMVGLVEQNGRYNPNLDSKYSTGVVPRIRKRMSAAVRDHRSTIRVPQYLIDTVNGVKLRARKENISEKDLTVEQVIEWCDTSLKQAKIILRVLRGNKSLAFATEDSEHNQDALEKFSDQEHTDPATILDLKDQTKKLQQIIAAELNSLEEEVVCIRYGLNGREQMTFDEIKIHLKNRFGHGRARYQQIFEKAMKKLRRAFADPDCLSEDLSTKDLIILNLCFANKVLGNGLTYKKALEQASPEEKKLLPKIVDEFITEAKRAIKKLIRIAKEKDLFFSSLDERQILVLSRLYAKDPSRLAELKSEYNSKYTNFNRGQSPIANTNIYRIRTESIQRLLELLT